MDARLAGQRACGVLTQILMIYMFRTMMVVPVSHLPVLMLPRQKQQSGAGAGSHHEVHRQHQQLQLTSSPHRPSLVQPGSQDTFVRVLIVGLSEAEE